MTARSFSVLRLLVEKKLAEKFDDVLASGVGRLSIIGDRDTSFDAGVVGSGGLGPIAVVGRALLLFLEAAFARSQRLRELHRARDRLVVERMIGTGIFDEVYIGTGFFQPCDIIAAWADRHPVVGDAVIKPDRLRADLFVIDQRDVAGRVETDIGGEVCSLRGVGALETLHASVK